MRRARIKINDDKCRDKPASEYFVLALSIAISSMKSSETSQVQVEYTENQLNVRLAVSSVEPDFFAPLLPIVDVLVSRNVSREKKKDKLCMQFKINFS
jgi:hypothetical protein